MYRTCILFIILVLFSGCSKNKTVEPAVEKLPKLGIVIKIPENFNTLPMEQLANFGMLKMTILEAEPFDVTPCYAYADVSGKGLIIVSELKFMDGVTPAKFPMNNIYTYKENIEEYFGSGEITSEEMGDDFISTVLMAMSFGEGDEEIYLFKGLTYAYPERFFVVDLYVINKDVSQEDALGFVNMFDSIGIYASPNQNPGGL
jgi:hypothetical protein